MYVLLNVKELAKSVGPNVMVENPGIVRGRITSELKVGVPLDQVAVSQTFVPPP
jgi:hypothetical protein